MQEIARCKAGRVVAPVALGEPVRPWEGIAFKRNKRHIGRDALTDPTTELRGLKLLEGFSWWSEPPKVRRRVAACGIEYVVPFDQSSLGGGHAEAGQELGV